LSRKGIRSQAAPKCFPSLFRQSTGP